MSLPTEWIEINGIKSAESIVSKLNKKEKENLLRVLLNDKKLKNMTIDKKDNEYTMLMNKPNMVTTDKENIERTIAFLKKQNILNHENIKKLDSINYGINYIEIWWFKFSREKFVPVIEFNDEPNQNGIYETKGTSEKKGNTIYQYGGIQGIYKTIYKGKSEYYLTNDNYIQQAEKQWKKAIKNGHIRKALEALPWAYGHKNYYIWWNILWYILNLSMSGRIPESKSPMYGRERKWKNVSGYLCSPGPTHNDNEKYMYRFDENWGILNQEFFKDEAYPCLYLVE